MAKEFGLLTVIHTGPNWPEVKKRLDKEIKRGQKIAYEITSPGLKELTPYVGLVERKKRGEHLSAEEMSKLRGFIAAFEKEPSIEFSAKLLYYARQKGCEIVPIGSRTASDALDKMESIIAKLKESGAPKEKIESVRRQKERLIAVKEYGAFRNRVELSSPDFVIVGAKHKKAFFSMPQRLIMDDMPKARAGIGEQLDASMKRRVIARYERARGRLAKARLAKAGNQKHLDALKKSAERMERINRLLDAKGFPKSAPRRK